MGYDVVGDIHGQDGKLVALLNKLGYSTVNGVYRHPEGRTALFLGDLIDRGPGQIEVINIVRKMIDAGSARSVMGNHELNAIGYATRHPSDGGYLRPHNEKNIGQHKEFLKQVGEGSRLHKEMIEWFKTLPPMLDLGGIRLCHAWWDQELVDASKPYMLADGSLSEEFLLASFEAESEANRILDGITKGMEISLPEGISFEDHSGNKRNNIRVRWWDHEAITYRKAAMLPEFYRELIPDTPVPLECKVGKVGDVPTFLGHYWLTGRPCIQNSKVAILDYSAAKNGPLVAYRWDGEPELSNASFVAAGA